MNSPYRIMWILLFFDLPTTTPEDRKAYTRFRKALLDDGFVMLQYSVYGRSCPSSENAEVHLKRVKAIVPGEGQVRIMMLTSKQFERMLIFEGKIRKKPEKEWCQLELF
jgi:CRISPR-associated protein Cas2